MGVRVLKTKLNVVNLRSPGDTLSQGISLLPVLLQSVEKAAAQPTQPQLVTEALSAACLLSRLSDADIQAGNVIFLFLAKHYQIRILCFCIHNVFLGYRS